MGRDSKLGIENLDRIFNPRRIAVIGASGRAGSVGAKILQSLTTLGFSGEVFPVNPSRQIIQGMLAYPSVSQIPGKVDLAVIATKAHLVPKIVEECGVAGVPGVVIISAGFRETGEIGAELERQVSDAQKKYSIRLIGPHSLGIIRPKANLYATFAEKKAVAGRIAFISQSAALCASVLDWAWQAQVGFSAVVSTGSMLDVDLGDLIDYFGNDSQTKAMMLYVESIKNPRKFMSAAREFARDKPIVLVKAGRFDETSEATLSHSGSLAGEDAVYDGAFKRAGIVRVETVRDLFNCAMALSTQPNPAGLDLTIITNAGGPAIMAADQLVAQGGALTQLSAETVQALKTTLPSYCSSRNPVDIYEEATSDRFRRVLEICFGDQNSSGFLVIYTPQGATDPVGLANTIIDLRKQTKKPILTVIMSEDKQCQDARSILQRTGIPSFATPEEAVSTFVYMHRYTRNLQLLYQTPEEFSVEGADPASLKGIIRRAFCEGRTVLSMPESMTFLEKYKIPVVNTLVAQTAEEAETLSSKLGYPVVMKALSPQVTHKSRIDGVILNICSSSDVAGLFLDLSKKVKNHSQMAEFQGVAIQSMMREKGYEILIGSKKDPQFGPVVLFGTGGTSAEAIKDVSIGFPPLNQVLARRLVEDTDVFRRAARSGVPLNMRLLEEILVHFSQLVTDFPEIREIDVNPLVMTRKEALVVDARIVLEWDRIMRDAADHSDHTLIAAYPKEYVTSRKLKDGTDVVLRPIRAEDEGRFDALLKSLSTESMRFRFFEVIKEIPHERLARYCNLDYDRQIAIVAELQRPDRQIIGAGRVITNPEGRSGEFAVLVSDTWQGLGLGSMFMDYIISMAGNMRLETIVGYVTSSNHKMLTLCKKKGFGLETLDEDTVKASLSF